MYPASWHVTHPCRDTETFHQNWPQAQLTPGCSLLNHPVMTNARCALQTIGLFDQGGGFRSWHGQIPLPVPQSQPALGKRGTKLSHLRAHRSGLDACRQPARLKYPCRILPMAEKGKGKVKAATASISGQIPAVCNSGTKFSSVNSTPRRHVNTGHPAPSFPGGIAHCINTRTPGPDRHRGDRCDNSLNPVQPHRQAGLWRKSMFVDAGSRHGHQRALAVIWRKLCVSSRCDQFLFHRRNMIHFRAR